MRQIQVADLTASANEIDTRMGPIPGRSSDRIANELRWAADEMQRAMDMLGDIPGASLTERLQNYVGCYMALQLKAAEAPAHTTNEPQTAAMCEALERFAKRADDHAPYARDETVVHFRLRDCRTARDALALTHPEGK